MAFIHTNFLTGNDSTGDGTTALPYKTVFKGLSVAGSGDTIKVAGGQWSSALAGDFTFTQDSNIIQTSVSQVGTVLVDDILSFEDNQFGFDKFHIKVTAVTSTTITTVMFWPAATVTTNTVKRLDAYHYSQAGTTPAQFEAWSTTDVQPNGRTGITISGGWSSDFTAQNGWTVLRRTGLNISSSNSTPVGFTFTASGGVGNWGTNLVWDRFLVHSITLWGNPGTGSSFAMNELATVKAVLLNNAANYFGLWQANPAVPAKLYSSTPGLSTNMNAINASTSTNTNRPNVFEIDIWSTICWNATNTPNPGANAGFGMYSQSGREGSINQMNLYIRQNVSDLYATYYPGYTASSNFAGTAIGLYVKKLTYYADKPQVIYWNLQNFQTVQVEDIEILGTESARSPLNIYGAGGQMIIDLSDEAKNINSFNIGSGWFGGNGFYTELYLNQPAQTNLSAIQVKDVEGLKTLDIWNNVYFKSNGFLKLSSGTSFSNNSSLLHIWKLIGVIDKPATSFTVNFTLKVDAGAEANWDYIGVQYGPNVNQLITQALIPTSSYATYTMTINPADYPDWNKFKFPVYFGIRSKSANIYDSEAQTYAYIQSVTVS